jgi:hypothetical protein
MTAQHLSIEGYWNVTVVYDVEPSDLPEMAKLMRRVGASQKMIDEATENLSGWNAGYTLTAFGWKQSIVFIGRATSLREFLNTVIHEVDHVHAHVAEYYDVSLGTEQAAYLQGYIGGRLLEFIIRQILIKQQSTDKL